MIPFKSYIFCIWDIAIEMFWGFGFWGVSIDFGLIFGCRTIPPGQFPLPFWVGHFPRTITPNMLCIHTYTCMHTHTHIHIHTYIHTYIYTHTYIHTYTYIHIQAYIHIHLYVCMRIYYVCTHIMYNYAKICQYI